MSAYPGDPNGPEYRVALGEGFYRNPKTQATWREVDKGGGVVERTYVDAPIRFGAQVSSTMQLAGSGPVTYPASAISTPKSKPERSEPTPIRRYKASYAWPDLTVLVSQGVIDHIRHTVTWTSGYDGLEQGGWLVGAAIDRGVAVTKASTDSKDRTTSSVKLSADGWKHLDRIRQAGVNFGPIGDWHAHPTFENWRPSQNDFAGWERVHRAVNIGEHHHGSVGIIATPDERGSFAYPVLTAFVTCRVKGRLETRPAPIEMLS